MYSWPTFKDYIVYNTPISTTSFASSLAEGSSHEALITTIFSVLPMFLCLAKTSLPKRYSKLASL